eukprot:1148441-Pelagomonas_calceolata.AAC.11
MLLTFLFVQVMYSAVFVRPGHGDVASLAPGLALYAALSTGEEMYQSKQANHWEWVAMLIAFKKSSSKDCAGQS